MIAKRELTDREVVDSVPDFPPQLGEIAWKVAVHGLEVIKFMKMQLLGPGPQESSMILTATEMVVPILAKHTTCIWSVVLAAGSLISLIKMIFTNVRGRLSPPAIADFQY